MRHLTAVALVVLTALTLVAAIQAKGHKLYYKPDARRLNAALRSYGSPLAGTGRTMLHVAHACGKPYDGRLLAAIAGAESSFGKHDFLPHNAWGYMGHSFSSFRQGERVVGHHLCRYYIERGLTTIAEIAKVWAPVGAANDPSNLNAQWPINVHYFYRRLGAFQVLLSKRWQ